MKNIDRIRAMSIEEMAKLIRDFADVVPCYHCAFIQKECVDFSHGDCLTGIEKWLQQEAEHDGRPGSTGI